MRNVVESNCEREAVKIVNTGVKAFCKAENKGATCPFRLAQDGSMVTIPFLKKRIGREPFTYEVTKSNYFSPTKE